jgi:sugar/nucleoside kinase (ribokinase family)
MARDRHIPVSFDGLFPTGLTQEAHQFVEAALFQSQLLKLNEYELTFWAGQPAPPTVLEAAERVFKKYQPVALMVTQAERGSFVMTAQGVADCPPVPVECVCGVGAGDAYIAGALHALYTHYAGVDLSALSNADWKRVGTFGNVAGALATRSIDAYSGIPTVDEMAIWLGKVPI